MDVPGVKNPWERFSPHIQNEIQGCSIQEIEKMHSFYHHVSVIKKHRKNDSTTVTSISAESLVTVLYNATKNIFLSLTIWLY